MSEVINTNKFLDFSGLKKYDALIKAFIASEDSKLSAAIDALVAKLGNLEFDGSDDKSVSEVIESIYASIAEIVEKQGTLEAKDAELEDMIAEEIAKIAGDEESLVEGASAMTLVEVANKLKALDDSVSKNTEDIAKVTERVSSLEKTIEDLGAIEGGENLTTIVSKVNDNAVAIETLNGDENTIGSVKKAAKDAADAAGAAALTDAKAYADGLAVNYDAAGTAAGLNAAMDERVAVLGAIDHEQLAADASAAAVAAIVAGADSDFDTLKEVADWIASDKEGSAALQTTVSNHTDSINTINNDLDTLEAKVEQDITNLTTHMSEAATALGEVDGRLDALEEFKNSHETITEEDINGLFA
jgi:hypothetical protein